MGISRSENDLENLIKFIFAHTQKNDTQNLHTNHLNLFGIFSQSEHVRMFYARQVINCAITMRTDMRAKERERKNLMNEVGTPISYHV